MYKSIGDNLLGNEDWGGVNSLPVWYIFLKSQIENEIR